jgi:hypothetical protein
MPYYALVDNEPGGQKKFKTSLRCAVPPLNIMDETVVSFLHIGNMLSKTERMKEIEEIIDKQVADNIQSPHVACFSYIEGSSGLGKTQLAFSFHRKVLFLPLGTNQNIYKHFSQLSDIVKVAAAEDIVEIRKRGHAGELSKVCFVVSSKLLFNAWVCFSHFWSIYELALK